MSTAQILKSMKGAPTLEKATYNRWSTHFVDVLSILDVERHILEIIPELSNKKSSEESRAIWK